MKLEYSTPATRVVAASENIFLEDNNEKIDLSVILNFLPKTITQIYGSAASGKTNICLVSAAKVAQRKKVVIIDTEGSFSSQRMKQITGDSFNAVMKNITLAEPSDFDEQKIAINKLEEILNNNDVGLIIIDSLVSLYRLEVGGGDAYSLNRELGKQMAILLKLSKKYNIPVIITNQVYASFEKGSSSNGSEKITPVGRDLLKYWTKVIIKLEKKGNIRKATIIRHKYKSEGSSCRFKILDSGIEEV